MSRILEKSEIIAWEKELSDKVLYNRNLYILPSILHDKMKVHPEHLKAVFEDVQRMREVYGVENLGPYSDFEWGMLLGKLVAIRWVLGADINDPRILDT